MRRLVLILSLTALACVAPVTGQIAMQTQNPSPVPTATRLVTATRLPEITATSLVAVVTASSLHVRVRPGEQSAVTGYLYNADAVTLTNLCKNGWAQIAWKGATAWVRAKYLSDNVCKE